MTSPDDRIAALFAADLPPARDFAFEAEVAQAVARRRFLADLGVYSVFAAAVSGLLWILWPSLAPLLEAVGRAFAPAGMALAMASTILIVTSARGLASRS